ncbi:MAG TPA: VIT1/CCC1 transporter family protein [Elusimicrobiota bacterium]|nr:VIT1/CCC1 transporter family protein [Elusimicrobiota bacterium]
MEPIDKNHPLARDLVLDELFDLTLYQRLQKITTGAPAKILAELIPVETTHVNFWKSFFGLEINELNLLRKIKMALIVTACRLFGDTAIHMVLEGIEIYGVRKYLAVWESYKDRPLGDAVRNVLNDEFGHEDEIVSQMTERKIDPEKIRTIFLGFNDGLVEILGAVSGFFAAFAETSLVLMAALSVAVAGSISMAAGVFVSSSSEYEVEKINEGKARFLGQGTRAGDESGSPIRSAVIVGISYFIGAMIPVFPVFFGTQTVWYSLATAGVMIILVSLVLSFLSGMRIRKRIFMNLVIISLAVGISYLIGMAVKNIWGISV